MGIMDKRSKEYDEYVDREFQNTMKSLNPTFEKNGWYAPRDFKEIRDWYYLEFKEYPNIADREIYVQWAEATQPKKETAPPVEQSEKLKNLPHKLCLLDDLGILGLIDERFNNKNYKGSRRETDKARLLATLLEIENPESVRQALKNEDYLSKIAKSRAVQTLQKHGLESEKLTD